MDPKPGDRGQLSRSFHVDSGRKTRSNPRIRARTAVLCSIPVRHVLGVRNILGFKPTAWPTVRKQTPRRTRGSKLKELVMMAFAEKHRASEVLPQLQRLQFNWSPDLQSAVAVEIESDGRLRMTHSQLLDPAAACKDTPDWKELLSAIVPLPYIPASSSAEVISQVRTINVGGSTWLRNSSLDQDFVRNAAALLRPGNSAILATVNDWQLALPVLCGFSHIVLHTPVSGF